MRGGGYETEADRVSERNIIGMVEDKWNCMGKKLKVSYKLDYALTRMDLTAPKQSAERIMAFCEVKTRKLPWDAMDRIGGYMISLDKWMAAEELSMKGNVPFILIVSADGDTRYLKIDRFSQGGFEHDGLIWQGRADRNDEGDFEPHVLLNIRRFKVL